MSVQTATTGEIAALYHATSGALQEHGTPVFGDGYLSDHDGLPVVNTPGCYTMMLGRTALPRIRERVGEYTPAGLMIARMQEVNFRYEEPHFTFDGEVDADDPSAYEYNPPNCDWQVDSGGDDIEHYVVEPGWSQRTGPTYNVKWSTVPRRGDERLDVSLTGLDDDATGSMEQAGEAATHSLERNYMSRQLANMLLVLTNHFESAAAEQDELFAAALS